MDFSVVIVSWNVKEKLKENLRSLLATTKASFEVIIVDNASSDGTVEMLRHDFPQFKTISNNTNKGFAAASNQGIALAQGDYIVLLNPDMKVMPDTFEVSLGWLEKNPQAAICGIRLIDQTGTIIPQVRHFPTLFDQVIITLKLAHVLPALLDTYLCKNFDYAKASRVDSIRGAFFIIRRSTLETLGSLDERYFLWFEEVDYCRRAKAAGLETWYAPLPQAVDYIGQSFNQVARSTKQKYFKDSMLAYFKKWQPQWQTVLLQLAWILADVITNLADIFKINSRTRT